MVGDGVNFLEKELREKGYNLRWTAEFNMFLNIALTIFPALYRSEYEGLKDKLDKVKVKIEAVCDQITVGEGYRLNNRRLQKALGWIQRGPFRLMHDWGRKFWSVDGEACTSCERCARICPVGNIHMEDGLPVYGNACVYCIRCFNFCPTYTIHYMGASNKRLVEKPPFQGPTAKFRPELITKK